MLVNSHICPFPKPVRNNCTNFSLVIEWMAILGACGIGMERKPNWELGENPKQCRYCVKSNL